MQALAKQRIPRIFDNIEEHAHFIEAIQRAVQDAYRRDFCVGYFNLRGWKAIADGIDQWERGEAACCRVLIGMQAGPRTSCAANSISLAKRQ